MSASGHVLHRRPYSTAPRSRNCQALSCLASHAVNAILNLAQAQALDASKRRTTSSRWSFPSMGHTGFRLLRAMDAASLRPRAAWHERRELS